jgi:ABC-type phosphate transport system substrate-binding protein
MKRIILIGVLFALLVWCTATASVANTDDLVLVGNKSVVDSMKKEEIKQIFLGKKTRWEDDTKITFAVFSDKSACNLFLKDYIGKTYSQYRNYWKKQVFTGKGRMPMTFKNAEELVNFISITEGAISFVRAQDIDTTETVKIITVE